jgi:sugar phosphate isomerase/epimerase
MAMKLGVSMWSYYFVWNRGEMDIPGFIHEAKRLGLDGVELLDFFWKDRAAETPAVKAALQETGLPVAVYSVSNNFGTPDTEERRKQVQIIRSGVDSAIEYGARVVRVFAADVRPDVTFEQTFAWIVEGLSEAAAYAYDHGIALALENHGLIAGRSDQVIAILKAVASPALKSNPDTGNFLLTEEASHEAVDKLATRAAMVHFKDFKVAPDDYKGHSYTSLRGYKLVGTAIGEGEVALEDCVRSLREAGFDGWLNIEYEGEEDPRTALPRSVEYARTILGKR